MRAAWTVSQPGRALYAEVVKELSTLKMVGEGNILDYVLHVMATHMAYFKPSVDPILSKLQ